LFDHVVYFVEVLQRGCSTFVEANKGHCVLQRGNGHAPKHNDILLFV
jgi:hypothetical protein